VDRGLGICQFLNEFGVTEVEGDWIKNKGIARDWVGRVPDLPSAEGA